MVIAAIWRTWSDICKAVDKTLACGDAEPFRNYLQSQSRQGQSTRTVARRLAAIRIFMKFRATRGEDPSAILTQLERPKPERSLPKILSRGQVNQLIAAPYLLMPPL